MCYDLRTLIWWLGVVIHEPVNVFSVRDLRQQSSKLIKDAERGQLSLITKHGRPAILAIPFDEKLLKFGVQRTLALRLFEKRHLTLAQAAKLAAVPTEDFMALAGTAGIVVVDYPPDEIDDEVAAARPLQ